MEKVVIEIPKGDTRKRHKAFDGSGMRDFGLIRDYIPINEGVMPIDYGYVAGTKSGEGDEVDALVVSDKHFEIGEVVDAVPIALIRRGDGDDKVLMLHSEYAGSVGCFEDLSAAEQALLKQFFGCHSPIISIEGGGTAQYYINEARTV